MLIARLGKKSWLVLSLVYVFLGTLFVIHTQAAVSLLYFRAVPENQKVKLQWATATELNNVGFFVQRSTARDTGYVRLNSVIIPAKGDGLTGGIYELVDSTATAGSQYWYILESIDSSQASQFSDPVAITVGSTPTVTATLTPSPTNATPSTTLTPTVTLTQPGLPLIIPTQNLTPNVIPTSGSPSPYPGPGSPPGVPPIAPGAIGSQPYPPAETVPVETISPIGEADGAGIDATWIPFPTVTIVFPRQIVTAAAPIPEIIDPMDWLFSRNGFTRLWPIGVLLLIWTAVGIWFYLSHRHLP
jgi:hypothetical protein